jgi:hypothetical protein
MLLCSENNLEAYDYLRSALVDLNAAYGCLLQVIDLAKSSTQSSTKES